MERDGYWGKDDFVDYCRQNGVEVTEDQAYTLERYVRSLSAWNEKHNLVSRADFQNMWRRHILHSIACLMQFSLPHQLRILDIGSGGGFPAVPILIARPDLRGTLFEPITRKWAYLKEVLHETGLRIRVRVVRRRVASRAEVGALGPFDYLTMRAVSRHEELLAGAADGLRPGGRALLFVGAEGAAAIRDALPLGLRLQASLLLPGRSSSYLVVVEKPTS